MDSALRVAARYAKEFPSEEALKDYLHEHPDADRKRHTVKKTEPPSKQEKPEPQGKPAVEPEKPKPKKPPQPEAKPEVEAEPEPEAKPKKKTWKERFTGISDGAKKLIESASEGTRKFLEDDAFRKEALKKAVKSIAVAPKVLAKNLVQTAKHEVEEFKHASAGIKAVLGGGKMSKKQKKAFKTVATHMAITGAAAAFTASGALPIAAGFSKGLARHIAAKSVSRLFEKTHIFDELGHIGHGLVDLLAKVAAEKKSEDPDEVMAMLVLAAVTKEIDALDDETIKAALEEAAKDQGKEAALILRVAARYQTAVTPKLKSGTHSYALRIHGRSGQDAVDPTLYTYLRKIGKGQPLFSGRIGVDSEVAPAPQLEQELLEAARKVVSVPFVWKPGKDWDRPHAILKTYWSRPLAVEEKLGFARDKELEAKMDEVVLNTVHEFYDAWVRDRAKPYPSVSEPQITVGFIRGYLAQAQAPEEFGDADRRTQSSMVQASLGRLHRRGEIRRSRGVGGMNYDPKDAWWQKNIE